MEAESPGSAALALADRVARARFGGSDGGSRGTPESGEQPSDRALAASVAGSIAFRRAVAQFLAVTEIALREFATWDPERQHRCGNLTLLYEFMFESIVSGAVTRMASLKSLERDFFTSWNELPGDEVRGFWAAVSAAGLPYSRTDRLGKILRRGRITSRADYDVAKDVRLRPVREGDGGLSEEDARRLSAMIGAFEDRSVRRLRRSR